MHAWSNTLQRRQKAKLLTDLWAPPAQWCCQRCSSARCE